MSAMSEIHAHVEYLLKGAEDFKRIGRPELAAIWMKMAQSWAEKAE